MSAGTCAMAGFNQTVCSARKADEGTQLAQLIREQSQYAQGSAPWKTYQDAISKAATHQPPSQQNNFGAPVAGVDEKGTPIFFQPGKTGGPPAIVPGVRPAKDQTKAPTEFEAKAGLYFKSMRQASQTLNTIEKTNAWRPSMVEAAAPNEQLKTLAQTESRQKYTQGQKQWIDSINRVRSGANLPEIEYDRAVRTFFPVFGEGENIRKQKAEARRQEELAMEQAAGKALPKASVNGWSIEPAE